METIESGMVVPAEETPTHSIWLSNLDLLVSRSHTPTVYFYPPSAARPIGGFSFAVEALKAALAKVLVPFYPLAGRLGLDSSGRVEIQCTGEGALFMVARSASAMDDVLDDFGPSDTIRQMLVPSVESGNAPCPLVMVQVILFKCGGVCLGVAVHHTAADGLGALHFVNSWSDIARGSNVSAPPSLDRTLLRARSPPTVLFDYVEYIQKPAAKPSTGKAPFDTAILKLSKEQLHLLKGSGGGKKGLSTFKAVTAHVWRSACKARKLGGDQETRLYMTADARTRVKPPLPAGFVGNGIFRTSAVAKAGEILSNSLEFGADKINDATVRLNDDYIRSLIDYLELQRDVRGLQKGLWVIPGTDLWVISWLGLPIYEADFGWGKPAIMVRATLQFSGLVYIMHDSGVEGGLSLAVAMEPENMPLFKQVFYEELEALKQS
ncbi:putrescine hydroxycinnamoyltransferase 1-like [Musa acuminata AAA Group]|uniref:putrescine hydroxycinnamoyltransferase 1-like n=1 Tax=Musa acuminata AAA Group TaxID=214697 RepID=UPI0031D55D7F